MKSETSNEVTAKGVRQMRINKMCKLTANDYVETTAAEATSRLLPAHMAHLTEWVGYGTVAGLRAKRIYYTVTEEDAETLEGNGGDMGELNWDNDYNETHIITDDGVTVLTLD